MMNFEGIFLQPAIAQEGKPSPTGSSPGGSFGMFLPMLLVFVIFYFLLIRPQAKQRKRHQELVKTLKKGDEVITSAGIHGKVASIAENLVTLEVADNVRIRMDRHQVATVKQASPAA